jgi:large subunit ribosomal protein L21
LGLKVVGLSDCYLIHGEFRRQGGLLKMQVVIATGGKQYLVKEGDIIRVEKLDQEKGKKVEFDQVLMVEKDGEHIIGRPLVEKAKVVAKILKQDKAKKIIVFKYKSKKRYRKKTGHRQLYTEILIEKIKI